MPLSDTSPRAEDFLIERLRAMSPAAKLVMVQRLNRELIVLSRAGIRARHGNISERELLLRTAALRLPRDTMIRVFGWDPEEKGY